MSKIFEALNRAENEPIKQPMHDRKGPAAETDRLLGRNVSQIPSTGFVDSESEDGIVALGPPPALEMDDPTRQELTRLAQSLFLRPNGLRLVTFASAESGAGCSWVVARLGQLLAEANAGSVCIVDANFRSPVQHYAFNKVNGNGLSDALVSSEPISALVQPLGGGRLHLLSSGSERRKAEPLLASTGFLACIDELRNEFDYVLFDTPPLSDCSDALVVAGRVEGLALVVEAGSTDRETARRAARDVVSANVRMLGVILNKRTYPIPQGLYKRL